MFYLINRYLVIFIVLLQINTVYATDKITDVEKIALIESMMKVISEQYVLKDKVSEINKHLQSLLNDPEVKAIENPNRLATYLSEQIVPFDGHFRVSWSDSSETVQEQVSESWSDSAQRNNHGFKDLEHLTGNIAYLDLRFFDGSPAAQKRADAVMSWLAGSEAVIIDLRENGGGSPSMVQYLCSYFFSSDKKVHLNSIYNRIGDSTTEFWTLQELPGEFMPDMPLYVLTSPRTASAAEEFAYNMKTQKRAIVIGEVTAGGANPGGYADLVNGFSMFVSTGMAINPITKTNWEGTGVHPDHSIAADDAFDAAYEMALKLVKERSDNPWQQREIDWKLEKIQADVQEVGDLNEYVNQYGRIKIVRDGDDLYYKRGRRAPKKMVAIATDYYGLDTKDGMRVKFLRESENKNIRSIAIQFADGREQRYPVDQD